MTELDQTSAPDETTETEKQPHRTLLEVWRELLKPARTNAHKPIGLAWAVRLKEAYPHLSFAELDLVRVGYFARLDELIAVLDAEISTDPDCFGRHTVEEDAEGNALHYKNLLLEWQQCFLLWEHEWSATSETAGVDAAVIAEVHKMFFGQMGLINHLDQINFEFTDADRQELGDALQAFDAALATTEGGDSE